MANNNVLFNAAMAGYLDGMMEGRSLTSSTATDYAAAVTEAAAFATEFDSLIANDNTISGGGGATLAPTTAAIQGAQLGKGACARSIAHAMSSGRYSTGQNAAAQATPAARAVALYTEAIASLVAG